jgi:predicted metal-dependent hydrolase
MTIRSTYALDLETARALEAMARRLGVSRSEALRRAIHAAAAQPGPIRAKRLDALDALQRSLSLTRGRADGWARQTRTERHSGSARREAKIR